MDESRTDDVKIYNLSSGQSIPEWISDRKRRKLQQHVDLRRGCELIQDFSMPDISRTINISPDGQYAFATGTYKPTLKCFDLEEMSLKFSRGLDAEVVKVCILSDDFTKVVLLEEDRYLEMHSAQGRHFRMRIPQYGWDMAFCKESGCLFVVGSSSEICRLNLETGHYLESLSTQWAALTCCEFNDEHQLFVCGTSEGGVEAWDHRDRSRVGYIDCAHRIVADRGVANRGFTSALKFKDALHLAVGTSNGNVLLYDIRSSNPLLVKDHLSENEIRRIEFVRERELVLSMDTQILKMWDETNGAPFAAIDANVKLNDFCRYPNSGLLFFANEAPKMLQYFVPAIGEAPKWCSCLDSITEELEESRVAAVYDDYKFVTAKELEELGCSDLVGTEFLRAYMHGYFMNARYYQLAKARAKPFDYENYQARKLAETIEGERTGPSLIKKYKEEKLPKVNKELAAKLHAEKASLTEKKTNKKLKKRHFEASETLEDDRFKHLFTNPDFQIDETSEQYRRAHPAMKKIDEKMRRAREEDELEGNAASDNEEDGAVSGVFMEEYVPSTHDDINESEESTSEESESESSEEDDQEVHNSVSVTAQSDEESVGDTEEDDRKNHSKAKAVRRPVGFELVDFGAGEVASQFSASRTSVEGKNQALGLLRSQAEVENEGSEMASTSFGGRQVTFRLKARGTAAKAEKAARNLEEHLKERRELQRDAREITRTLKRLPVRGGFRGRRGRKH